VRLAAGGSAAVDESYLREAILTPSAHLIAGYTPVMPAYQGQLTEEQVLDVIAYIRSLGNAPGSEGKAQP
jgi:cytochrome c oxidase subunit 2